MSRGMEGFRKVEKTNLTEFSESNGQVDWFKWKNQSENDTIEQKIKKSKLYHDQQHTPSFPTIGAKLDKALTDKSEHKQQLRYEVRKPRVVTKDENKIKSKKDFERSQKVAEMKFLNQKRKSNQAFVREDWIEAFDKQTGKKYYFNQKKGASVTEKPEQFGDELLEPVEVVTTDFRSKLEQKLMNQTRKALENLEDAKFTIQDVPKKSERAEIKIKQAEVWKKVFNPLSRRFEFVNQSTNEKTFKKPDGA